MKLHSTSHKFRKSFVLLLIFLISDISFLNAQIIQWRGPNRDGKFPDKELLKEWPTSGPEKIFVTEGLGKGFSSVIATKDKIYATGTKDTIEYLTCLDMSGKIIWQQPYGRCWYKSFPEARTTPTLDGNRIYVLSGIDNLVCFNALDGEKFWSVDIHKTYDSRWDMFGVSESVLIADDMIITTPAGEKTTVIALNKLTGELIWKSESIDAKRSNMSPVIIDHCGKKYIITATQTHLLGVDIKTGEILWKYHYNFLDKNNDNSTILANTPLYKDSCLWVSNGWDVKSVMLEISPDGKSIKEKFKDQTFDNQNHGMVQVNGYVYGSNFTGRQSGKWICMNWNTGEILWIGDFHNNKGPIIYADDMLYCIDERKGNIALVEATPKKYNMISSFKISDGKGPFWSRPAIYNGKLFIRHGDVLIAYKLIN